MQLLPRRRLGHQRRLWTVLRPPLPRRFSATVFRLFSTLARPRQIPLHPQLGSTLEGPRHPRLREMNIRLQRAFRLLLLHAMMVETPVLRPRLLCHRHPPDRFPRHLPAPMLPLQQLHLCHPQAQSPPHLPLRCPRNLLEDHHRPRLCRRLQLVVRLRPRLCHRLQLVVRLRPRLCHRLQLVVRLRPRLCHRLQLVVRLRHPPCLLEHWKTLGRRELTRKLPPALQGPHQLLNVAAC